MSDPIGPDDIELQVQAWMTDLGIEFEVLPCDPDLADTAQFCEHYGIAPEASGNTIIVASKKEPKDYVACLVTAPTRLDVNKRVRKLMGARKASFASADETKDLTGMMIGGVTVFALPDHLSVFIDSRIMDLDFVWVGGGSRSAKLKVRPAELHKVPNLEVVEDLANPIQ
jgi:prolyl-tRNA editing enzyme YbaK/EbsC (Cys-tRNA(Pro) deacylase)